MLDRDAWSLLRRLTRWLDQFKDCFGPQARAFVQEIFTGLLFISRPQYMRWMREAEQRFHQLRI